MSKTAVLCIGLLFAAGASAFDMSATLQEGGWQEREEVTTNKRGKITTASRVWMGVVGREEINGVPHVWLEARTQELKINRKGERRNKGDLAIMKTLVEESALTEFTNPLSNMRKFGKEIIIKTGDAQAMRMREGGLMASAVMQGFGIEIDFKFENTGETESFDGPNGNLTLTKFLGSGSTEAKMLIRTMRVQSEVESWMSEDVPFGIVKQTTRSTTNGKPSTIEMTLLNYGSGATSMINDGDVQDMPGLNLPGISR